MITNEMNTLFLQQTVQSKTQIRTLRSLSTLALVDKPLTFTPKYDNFPTSFNPIHLFNFQSKSQNPKPKQIKTLHAHTLRTGLLQSDIFVANSLIGYYFNSGTITNAVNLFDKMPQPNSVSWNLMISGYNQSSQYEETWRIFCGMRVSGVDPIESTYGCVLAACVATQAVHYGRQVYSLVLKNGFFGYGYVRSGMIDLFAKNSFFEEALKVFLDVSCENVVCWNAIIAGAVRNKENFVALDLFNGMLSGYSKPNDFTFPTVLTASTALGELEVGRGVHGRVIKGGLEEDVFVGTAIVDFYAKLGQMDEAVKGFSLMPVRNVVSWTAIISAFVQKEDSVSALQFFKDMRIVGVEVNKFTLTSVLSVCAKPTMLDEANQLHSWILKAGLYSDSAVKDSLINVYSKIGEMASAEKVFGEMEGSYNVETWAIMISCFSQNRNSARAMELFQRIFQEGHKPNTFCCSSVLSIVDSLHLGQQIHSYILKAGLLFNVTVGSALFTMYSKNGSLDESYEVFTQIHNLDGVSWTSMIAGFIEHGCADQAIHLFRDMVLVKIKPDKRTLSSILTACSALLSIRKGKEVHGYALRACISEEVLVGDALISMYSKCGSLYSAEMVFQLMPEKDQMSWSSLISAYALNGCTEVSLSIYKAMLVAGFPIDSVTISSLLTMAATLTNSALGQQLHALVLKMGLDSYLPVGSSLVTMYSKCGSIDDSLKVFDRIESPDLVTWTAMIIGYAQHGKGMEALRFFELMREKGVEPDSVSFVGILTACSHIGLVEQGYFYWNLMVKDYGIQPSCHHYACIVDLLGRSGRLREAEEFISTMPIEPDAWVWRTLLAACKMHGDVELGKLAAKRVCELEPSHSGAYVSLSNIFAAVGNWEEVMDTRNLMKGVGVSKEPAWSSV